MKNNYDVIVIGAGAAGLMFSGSVSEQLKCLVIEANKTPGKKIIISGGGRCNFTNMELDSSHYYSKNSHFSKSALSRYSQWDFIDLVANKKIPYYEKKLGQLFCEKSSKDILNLLMDRIKDNVTLNYNEKVIEVIEKEGLYVVRTSKDEYFAKKIVISSGGLSLPTIGASDLGIKVAKHFGHKIIETVPALVPLTLENDELELAKKLAGVSLAVKLTVDGKSIEDDLLFTHKGLSGPVILKGSLYWNPKMKILIDFIPGQSFQKIEKENRGRTLLNSLSRYIPKRLAEELASHFEDKKMSEFSRKDLEKLEALLKNYTFSPNGTEGYRKAEVTRGGVSTDKVSSKSFESKLSPGLFFIGEVLDVTGLLGGYNFQWAWSSAVAAAATINDSQK